MELFTRRNIRKNSQSQNIQPLTSQPSDLIRDAAYQTIWPLFNGNAVGPIIVRPLRHSEIEACGNFSLIETFFDKVSNKKISPHDMLDYLKIQHRIIKASLVIPTYDEVMKAAGVYENLESCKERINEFRKEVLAENDKIIKGKKQDELTSLELLYYQVLPADFTGTILSYALEFGKSDIKKLDEENLLTLAVMAKNNNNRPSDNIDGLFTSFNRADIDRRAWSIYIEEQEKNKRASRRRNS